MVWGRITSFKAHLGADRAWGTEKGKAHPRAPPGHYQGCREGLPALPPPPQNSSKKEKKKGVGGRSLHCYFPASVPASPAALRGARISLQPALPARSAAPRGSRPRPRRAPGTRAAAARALTDARRCRARPESRRGGPAALPAPHPREGGREERRGSSGSAVSRAGSGERGRGAATAGLRVRDARGAGRDGARSG